MAIQKGPWGRSPRPRRIGPGGRVLLWLTLLVVVGVGVWQLAELFPGQVSSDIDRAYLVSSLAVLALVSSGLIFARRINFGEAVRNLAIWAGIAAVLVLGFTYQNELRDIALRVRSELVPGYPVTTGPNVMRLTEGLDRHFTVIGTANGAPIRFLIDTGASDIVLSPADARRLGIDLSTLSFTKLYQTANGVGRGAPLILRTLAIGPIELNNVAVSVNETDMGASLLGMTFLRNLASVEIQGRDMVLRWR